MNNDIARIRAKVRNDKALIHCITNPIAINQSANAILAVGARPIMAEHPEEVREITSTAASLLLNLGNITDVRMESMRRAAEAANISGIPVTLDLVGVACSALRRDYVWELLGDHSFTLLKGNYSEILSLVEGAYKSSGVDAEEGLPVERISGIVSEIAGRYGCTVLATGEKDIVSDGGTTYLLSNGTPQLASLTGTGCMLGALAAAYLSAERTVTAVITACTVLGISGEEAETEKGSGTFMTGLMDQLCTLSDDVIADKMKWRTV